jgi:mono/diheme cytochrome c family protein
MTRLHLLLLMLLPLLIGCEKLDMAQQAKNKAHSPSELFADGKTNQTPPEGTVARGDLAETAILAKRPPMTAALLERGRQRFDIFCQPCHGRDGYGDGTVVQRGFPHPPSYHIDRLRNAPDSHFLDVIRQGYGAMYSYDARVPPTDRWAIVAYIRALQLSQHAKVADLPADLRGQIEDGGQ